MTKFPDRWYKGNISIYLFIMSFFSGLILLLYVRHQAVSQSYPSINISCYSKKQNQIS